MLIKKSGISRDIDEKDLQVYRDKGYSVAEEKAEKEKPVKEKPIEKMNTTELEAKAAELEVDISECKTNAERAAKIAEKLSEVREGGE
mgnify:CR=1 FL=1